MRHIKSRENLQRRWRSRAGLLSVVLATLLATLVAGGSAASAKAAKGAPIVFGVTCQLGAPVNNPSCASVTKAYFASINAHGGINGRPLQLEVCGNQSSATVSATCMQGFFDNSKVVGLIGDNLDCGYAALDATDPMADIGTEPTCGPEDAGKDTFSSGGSVAAGVYAILKYVHKLGITKMAYVTCTVPACTSGIAPMEAQMKTYGMDPLDVISAPLTATSYLPYALVAKNDGAQAVFISESGASIASFISTAHSIGYNPQIFDSGQCYDQTFLASVQGIKGNDECVIPYLNFTTKSQLKAVMDQYGPVGWDFDFYAVGSWVAAHMAVQDIQGIHGAITRKSVLAGMKKLTNFTNEFLPAPLDFAKPGPTGAVGVRSTHFVIYKVSGVNLKQLAVVSIPPSANALAGG